MFELTNLRLTLYTQIVGPTLSAWLLTLLWLFLYCITNIFILWWWSPRAHLLWGCYGLCQRHKLTKLAHSFLFCACVCFCLYGPFNSISFHKFFRQLFAFSLCSSGINSALLVLSTTYLFTKVSLSSNVILCGWLGLKHQLTSQHYDWCECVYSAPWRILCAFITRQ